ncbi:DnaJ-like protein [Chloropicon primus]|nr:DnaJ-like protein [Chloropicon primus]
MSLHVFGESFKDELVVRGGRQLEAERHPLYRRQANHAPLRVSNQQAFNRFMQQCYEEAERKLRLEDAREREVAAREGRPYRSREERERLKKEKEEREKRESEERRRRGESDGSGFRPKAFDANVSYYETLGIDENASSKEIKRAYKKLALKYHPDKMAGKSEEEVREAEQIFKEAMEAYEILADEDVRESYDKARDAKKYGKNSPMNDPQFAESVARRREQARRDREMRMNTKEERIEVIVVVTLGDLHSGCVKEIQYQKRYFEKNESGEFTKYEQVKKVLEIKKGWNPSDPLVLDSEGHQSKEYQTGDVYCLVQEQEHEHFERRGTKDLALKDHLCPKYDEGDILKLVSVETLEGVTRNIIVSYVPLLLSGGGETMVKMASCGMPDPKAPFFDPPGDLWLKVNVPVGKVSKFELARDFLCPRKVYMVGNERSRVQSAFTALRVCGDYAKTLEASKKVGVCICLADRTTRGADTFMSAVRSTVAGFKWLTIFVPVGGVDACYDSLPALLDEEVVALESADITIVDPGEADFAMTNLIAPIDEGEPSPSPKEREEEGEEVGSTIVMSYGVGSYGQLALGERDTQSDNFREVRMNVQELGDEEDFQPVGVAAGESHSAVLLSNGDVLTCGMGNLGQTGRPESKSTFELAPVLWDVFTAKPKIVSVACGGRHTLLVDERGSVWSFGCSRYGQLGHGDTYDVNEPQQVWPEDNLRRSGSDKAVEIAAGASHSMMRDSRGRVWTWGHNKKGELGVGDYRTRLAPELLGFFGNVAVSSVSAGKVNSAFVTDSGEVFTCGSSTSDLLGYAASIDVSTPRRVESLNSPTVRVRLQEFAAVSCDSTGRMFVWGALGEKRGSPTTTRLRYKVIHKKVVVRSGPSTSSQIAGVKYFGDVIVAEKRHNGWICLAGESYPKGPLAKGNSFWMLIDGSDMNLGLLLRDITNDGEGLPASGPLGLAPHYVPFDKNVKDVACLGRNVVACCEEGRVWSISLKDVFSCSGGTIVPAEEITCVDRVSASASVLSGNTTHLMIVNAWTTSSSSEESTETDNLDLADPGHPEVDVVERAISAFQQHDLFRMLWRAYLRGSIVATLGEACSLLGVSKGNCKTDDDPFCAVIPHVIRRCKVGGDGGMGRLQEALKSLAPNFAKNMPAPYNDVMGASFPRDSVLAWEKDPEFIVPAPEASLRSLNESSDQYLSDLCLSSGEIGGGELSPQWTHRMSLHAIAEAMARAGQRLKVKEEQEANMKLIREEECKVMGAVMPQEERSNFDVFGCERGACEHCQECQKYAQPYHLGLASGSYCFLCANCGCPHSKHAEVVH